MQILLIDNNFLNIIYDRITHNSSYECTLKPKYSFIQTNIISVRSDSSLSTWRPFLTGQMWTRCRPSLANVHTTKYNNFATRAPMCVHLKVQDLTRESEWVSVPTTGRYLAFFRSMDNVLWHIQVDESHLLFGCREDFTCMRNKQFGWRVS